MNCMAMLMYEDRTVNYQWASDVAFAGIRLEVLFDDKDVLFDVSIPDEGPLTVNTFGNDVVVGLLNAALEVAEYRRQTS